MARILIIDDEPSVRATLRLALEEAGHDVAEAENGRVGMRRFREQPADVVVCDILMPEKEGLETIRDLCKEFPGVRIIAMSGGTSAGANYVNLAPYFGAARALCKPFEMKELLRIVDELLQGGATA